MNVTAIIPVRWSRERQDVIDRAVLLARQVKNYSFEVIIVVDDVDREIYSGISDFFRVVFTNRGDKPMSLSIARNLGAELAKSTWLLFLDADLDASLIGREDFYSALHSKLLEGAKAFLTFPVFYLDSPGRNIAKLDLLSTQVAGYLAGASSVVLVRRTTFNELGGYDEGYVGWGYEDHDFARRLIANQDIFPLPESPHIFDPRPTNEQGQYVGWRSLYSYIGDLALNAGLIFLHHPHAKEVSFVNRDLVEKNRLRFINGSNEKIFAQQQLISVSIPKVPRFALYNDISRLGYWGYHLRLALRRAEVAYPETVNLIKRIKRKAVRVISWGRR